MLFRTLFLALIFTSPMTLCYAQDEDLYNDSEWTEEEDYCCDDGEDEDEIGTQCYHLRQCPYYLESEDVEEDWIEGEDYGGPDRHEEPWFRDLKR